eukprot:GILI01028153.1.p1 GENE.GILI01028153.1~~GILI01028153.1.p1  ORF type:complete len:164 (-),score=28.00 GILI01028153.1:130-621(-)
MLGSRLLFRSTNRLLAAKTINNVTLVGVVHDIQTGFVYEDPVTQFTLTTTSIDTTNPSHECVVEKDHHTIRCFGDLFSADVKSRIKEGNVVCVNGRMRLNPQLEPSCNKHFYFPFIHVQPPHGQVSVVHSDRRKAPGITSTANAAAVETPEAAATTAATEAPK